MKIIMEGLVIVEKEKVGYSIINRDSVRENRGRQTDYNHICVLWIRYETCRMRQLHNDGEEGVQKRKETRALPSNLSIDL